jgi:rusticyanin
MMGRYGLGTGSMMSGSGSMMGGAGYGWMMGRSGYGWMMGGPAAPGWMSGGSLPGFMMGASTDPGQVMGRLFADAPGPRVSPAQATTLGDQVPAGASMDRAANRITFTDNSIDFAVVASPAGNPDETFRIAGLVNPTIVVPQGAHVSIRLVNADPDTAHGLVVTASGAGLSWMPMMANPPAFSGAALWFLGNPTPAGMHTGTISFAASTSGSYQYLCPVPGHAQKGMVGSLVVS